MTVNCREFARLRSKFLFQTPLAFVEQVLCERG